MMTGNEESETSVSQQDDYEFVLEERNRVRITKMQDQMKTVKFDSLKTISVDEEQVDKSSNYLLEDSQQSLLSTQDQQSSCESKRSFST